MRFSSLGSGSPFPRIRTLRPCIDGGSLSPGRRSLCYAVLAVWGLSGPWLRPFFSRLSCYNNPSRFVFVVGAGGALLRDLFLPAAVLALVPAAARVPALLFHEPATPFFV
jgi:hypothetical protein